LRPARVERSAPARREGRPGASGSCSPTRYHDAVSKGFTKDDATDVPLVVPARPPLPEGTPNYVTPRGLGLLREEHAALAAARAREQVAADGDSDAAHRATVLATRIGELEVRLSSAELVDPATQPHDEVRFGATVTVRPEEGAARSYRIVGVDEADARAGMVAFVSPVARALLGRRVGEVAVVRSPRGEEELEVTAIAYQ
jgi:transcription elongation factor GreB